MRIGICSYSFHRLLADGKQDIFKFITDSKDLGCTQLDPWCAHLNEIQKGADVIFGGDNPDKAKFSAAEDAYIDRVKEAGEASGLPWGCMAIDGSCVYDEDPKVRDEHLALSYRWLDIAGKLGCEYARIDAGGPAELPDDVFAIIKEGYDKIIAYANERGVKMVMENHFGPSLHPDKVVQLIEGIDGLGLLFDTNNWAEGKQQEGWEKCAKYAEVTHVKTFSFDENGDDPSVDLEYVIKKLKDLGFDGCWGVESVPKDGDELTAAAKTIDLIKRYAA